MFDLFLTSQIWLNYLISKWHKGCDYILYMVESQRRPSAGIL